VYAGWSRPTRVEADIFQLEITGEVPRGLAGRFYSIAPETQFPPRMGDDVRFNGDGMIRMFTFTDGHVDFRSRYVQTEKLRAERAARRSLFGHYRNPFTDDESVRGLDRSNANTALVFHGGRLLALKEDSRPIAVDARTLETEGQWTFDGDLVSETFTAHPKVDARTGEMFFFGYEAKGLVTRDIAYAVTDADGRITHEAWLQAPYVGFMHDFAVTEDYVIFPVFPATADLARLRAGGPHWRWDPKRDTYFGVMPRYGTVDELRWFTAPPRYGFHFFNAHNDATTITLEGCLGEAITAPFLYPDTCGNPIDPRKAVTRISRWTLDVDRAESFAEATLDDDFSEYPIVDARVQTRRQRFGFVPAMRPADELSHARAGLNQIVKFDFEHDHRASVWTPDEHTTVQEPMFVPRDAQAAEGDGYLIVIVNRWDTMLNDLVVLDTRDLERGPLATVHLPLRIASGVHTLWLGEDQLDA
jgi:carotenoid cleavage dioxygenase